MLAKEHQRFYCAVLFQSYVRVSLAGLSTRKQTSLVLFSFVRERDVNERDEFNYLNLTREEQGSTTGGGSHDLTACI